MTKDVDHGESPQRMTKSDHTVRWPGAIYPTRPIGTYPQQYVQRRKDGRLDVVFSDGTESWAVSLSRLEARLLAKRLNQCLEDTKRAGIGGPS